MKSITEFESWSALVTQRGILELGIQKNRCRWNSYLTHYIHLFLMKV